MIFVATITQIVFLVLKVSGIVDWEWPVVITPAMAGVAYEYIKHLIRDH